jgi:uncharacterized protein (TIGR02444 family)
MTVPPSSFRDKPALWPFACALYEAPGVSEAAIMLQDRQAVDVNIMLFVCWVAGFEGGVMTTEDIDTALDATSVLREESIRPLRAERRAIPKGGEREAERQRLLDLELAAEKAELGVLEELWRARLGEPLGDRAAIETMAVANLQSYFTCCDIDMDLETAVWLAHLARTAAEAHAGEGTA